jgi:DNA topoisomerase-1
MENKLDLIANNNMTSNELCLENYNLIESLIKTNKLNSLNHKKEGEFQIDEIHSYIIGKFGPVIKCNQNNKITFKKVKDNLDIDKLKNNELLLDDIIDTENTSINNNIIGKYKDFDIIIKNGKYGYYILYNSKNISIDKKKYDIDNLSYETAIEIIDNYYNNQNKSIIRIINDEFSIRKGKFGDYIYYKTVKMKKPKFINLNNFKHDYTTCDENLIFDFI